jgi:hypothetical protein
LLIAGYASFENTIKNGRNGVGVLKAPNKKRPMFYNIGVLYVVMSLILL